MVGSSVNSLVRPTAVIRVRRLVATLTAVSSLCVLSASCSSPLLSVAIADKDGPGGTVPDEGHMTCATPRGSDRFATAGAEELDMDRARLRRAVSYATARGAQSVRIYRHGCLVARSGNDPVTENMRLAGWSMTKGVVSVVVGRAAAMGLLSVDDPISEYLDGTDGLEVDEAHGDLTIRQFLTQTTGLRMAWVNDLWAAGSTNSVADELARPFQAEPGSTFLYAQTAVTVLVAVVEAAAGEDFQSFARRELFEPLGIPRIQWRWDRDASGRTQGFAFLDMAPVAWARLGHLLLREGMWGERRLIDADYVRQGREGTEANPGYGFLWRTNSGDWNIDSGFPRYKRNDEPNWPGLPRDAFAFSGLFDQHMIVIPSLDMVMVRMGFPPEVFGDPIGESPGIRPNYAWRFNRLLMRAVTDVQVHDPGPWRFVPPDHRVDIDNLIELTLPPFGIGAVVPDPPATLGELLLMGATGA